MKRYITFTNLIHYGIAYTEEISLIYIIECDNKKQIKEVFEVIKDNNRVQDILILNEFPSHWLKMYKNCKQYNYNEFFTISPFADIED